jgi:hypothetical protein
LIEEWLDLQLIADLTETVGRLVYWPFTAMLLLMVSRSSWWDHWTWPKLLIFTFGINLALATASYVILQRAALRAREIGVEQLNAKVNQKLRQAAGSLTQHESNQGERILEEISKLRRGAFAPISKSPLVGALLVNCSGAVLLALAKIFLVQ